MLFTMRQLSEIFPEYAGDITGDTSILSVTTDSRKKGKGLLFVPIIGENFDAHDFAAQAVENGAIALLWQKDRPLPTDLVQAAAVFLVEDTVEGLQQLAKSYRDAIQPKVIGITGSNGKTTTKDLAKAVMHSTYRTHSTAGNFNNHIGLPLTILEMPRDTEVLILEMGMSNFGEIDVLSKIARPDISIITNIGESHIEYLGSREGIAKAKLEIINGMDAGGELIIDGDEPLLQNLEIEQVVTTVGFSTVNEVVIKDIQLDLGSTTFSILGDREYMLPLAGKHHAKNAAYIITAGKMLGIPVAKMQQALTTLERTGMRFESLKGINGASIINDAYNASPTSMRAAIDVIKQMEGYKTKILVLGDILELGEFAKDLHEDVAKTIEPPIDVLLTYGSQAENIHRYVEKNEKKIACYHFATKEELLQKISDYLNEDSLFLFKASRGLKFETLVTAIQDPSGD